MTMPATPASQGNEADLIRETERARLRSLVAADIAEAGKVHAPDFQLITPIGVVLSKDEYLGAIAAGQIRYLAWEPGEIAVRLYGEVAVIRYPAQLAVVFASHKVPLTGYWHTDTYERRDGKWMIVWSQATAISQQVV